jgi:hypothetical protein
VEVDKFLEKFNGGMKKILTLIVTYQNLLTNYFNVLELEQTLSKENALLKKDIVVTSSDILTNSRKTYYEDQVIENLQYWYSWFQLIYIATLIAFIISFLMLPRGTPRTKYIVLFVGLVLYPFIIDPIVLFIMAIFTKIGNLFPKNVYSNL